MSQTLSLYRLQQVDSHIDLIKNRREEIQRALNDETELQIAAEKFNEITNNYHNAVKALDKAETEAKNQRLKIEQTESVLYKGMGNTPKELLDLQNDAASRKRHLITLEEIQLDAMVLVEELNDALHIAEENLQKSRDRSAELKRDLYNELISLEKDYEKLVSERFAIAEPIQPELISIYDKLRQQRRGMAVSVIIDNSCSACGSGLTAALIQSSRTSNELTNCPSCGRILYGN